jgi:hypothetical protein
MDVINYRLGGTDNQLIGSSGNSSCEATVRINAPVMIWKKKATFAYAHF